MSTSVLLQVSSLALEECLVSLMFQEKDYIDILGQKALDTSHFVHVPEENWHQNRANW